MLSLIPSYQYRQLSLLQCLYDVYIFLASMDDFGELLSHVFPKEMGALCSFMFPSHHKHGCDRHTYLVAVYSSALLENTVIISIIAILLFPIQDVLFYGLSP